MDPADEIFSTSKSDRHSLVGITKSEWKVNDVKSTIYIDPMRLDSPTVEVGKTKNPVQRSLSDGDKSANGRENSIKTLEEKGTIKGDTMGSYDLKKTQKSETNQEGLEKTNQIFKYSKIFKKVSLDGHLILFLPHRELMVAELRFNYRNDDHLYGRDDEELMGLRFSNDIVIVTEQIFPTQTEVACNSVSKPLTNELGFIAIPFVVDMGETAPPSVRLVPCRPYIGAPIGTTYHVLVYPGLNVEDLPPKRQMVQMSLRLYERTPKVLPLKANIYVEKRFVFHKDDPLIIKANLDKGSYTENEVITLRLAMYRSGPSGHGVRKIKMTIYQQVSVAMFSSGSFKNSLGHVKINYLDSRKNEFEAEEKLAFCLSKDYAWIAMDETSKRDSENVHFAPSVVHANKALFIVRVSYLVQVKLFFGILSRPIKIKLPFLLKRQDPETPEHTISESKLKENEKSNNVENKENDK